MMRSTHTIVAIIVALLLTAAGSGASATGATDWSGADNGKVRLLAGSRTPDGVIFAGVQIVLAQGWKTYWKVPGDSGVPPQFDWSRSRNVAEVEVKWPVPGRFRDDYGWNNGYGKEVLFPVRIKPVDADSPVELALTLRYGVCRELCIPGRADLELTLPSEGGITHQAMIDRHLARVPKPPEEVNGLRVAGVEAFASGKDVFLDVSVERTAGESVSLFVEGPSKYYFGRPLADRTATPDHSRFRIRVDGAKDVDALKGTRLVFTAVQGDLRLEQSWSLD